MTLKIAFVISSLCLLNSCEHKKNETHAISDFATELKQLVLKENVVGQEYLFKVKKPDCVLEYEVAYIGDARSKRNGLIKFVAFTVLSGNYEDSKRANSSINLYNKNGALLGSYYVGGRFDAQPVIANDTFIFIARSEHCNQTTRISFKDSIPSEIFLNCEEENGKMFGDVYGFDVGR